MGRPGGAVKTERDVMGNTRLDVVSREARALGVRAGQTVAAARAKCAELRVRVVAEGAVRGALARVAEVALAFGPATAFDVVEDVVWVDVGGCEHLHGGEPELARALDARVRSLGHACRVAVADGPRIAAAVARFASARKPGPLVVAPGQGAAAMRVLPIAALALDDDAIRWLVDLGLPRCGDLQKLPRRSLGTRLGPRAHDVMQLLDGEDRAPLDAWRPPEVPEERVELEWGAHSIEALAFVLKTLCDRLAVRLEGRAMAAARLELVLGLDRALCEGAPHVSTLEATLPAPIARAADLLAVVRSRLEHQALAAPVLTATLRAPELARAPARTGSLLAPEPKAERALPRLVAELAAELGTPRVGVLALVDTWAPDERTRLVPLGSPAAARPSAQVTSALEPSRLVEPSSVARDALDGARLLARVEDVAWWRRTGSGVGTRRDLVAWWVGAKQPQPWRGQRPRPRPREEEGLAWVEVLEESARLRGWID
ncbi:MAG TPA: DNA polymerase Y family protein [Polyangiaceae bacterium]